MRLTLLLAALVATGCALSPKTSSAPPPSTQVEIENTSWSTITVRVVSGSGEARPIARQVAPFTTAYAVVRSSLTPPWRFHIDPLGGEAETITEPIYPERGRPLRLTVPVRITTSFVRPL